jgi:hypothetical protein
MHNASTEHRRQARAMKNRRARRHEGHVYRRGDIWWFKWTGLDGQPMYRSSASTERDVAEDMLRAELDRKSKGLTASPDPRRCCVDDLLEALEARYKTEGRRSLERLKYSKDQLLRLFQNVAATRVTGADILRDATQRLEEKAAPATMNRELAALRAAYRLGLENDVITAMPRIKLLPENNVRKGFADAQQVEAICRHLRDDIADAVRFAFQTGWRRSEVFGFTWARSTGTAASSGWSPERRRAGRGARSRSRRRSGGFSNGGRSTRDGASARRPASFRSSSIARAARRSRSSARGLRPASRRGFLACSSTTSAAAQSGTSSARGCRGPRP